MATIGYARVSTTDQRLDVQRERLQACERVYEEKESGKSDARERLQACLEYVREGDTLCVTRLDRLARSTLHLCQIAAELQRKGVDLRVLDQAIDTSSSTGRLLFHMLAAIAQFELELRAERQAEGIRKARERGVRFGRAPLLSEQAIGELRAMREAGASIARCARTYRISQATVYRYLQDADEAFS